MNIVRPFVSPGISQHFHNKKQFMRSESFECLTLYHLSSGMLAKRELLPCLLKKALEALLGDQIVLVPAYLVEKTSALIKCSLLLLNIRSVFFFLLWNVITCPQETAEGVSCDLSVAVSWWPSYLSRQNPATR